MTEGSATASTAFATRFLDWARRSGLSRKLAITLAAAAVASGAATYGVITESGFAPNPRTVLFLLILDLILLLLLGAVVAWRIVRLWAERRRGLAGSQLLVEPAVPL